jgi:NAD-dependent deacetylase
MNTGGIRQIAEQIKASARVVVLTGAGISQESGVPTFRGEDGLWQNFRAEELAAREAFLRVPVVVWRWDIMPWLSWNKGLRILPF